MRYGLSVIEAITVIGPSESEAILLFEIVQVVPVRVNSELTILEVVGFESEKVKMTVPPSSPVPET